MLGLKPDAAASWAGAHLPKPALIALLRSSLGDFALALCLHRVARHDRPSDWQPGLNMAPAELDALIELLLASRPGASGWLTVSFDDGYDDAARYIASRALKYPGVDFMFFICPEKLETRAGFRWDLAEEALRAGTALETARAVVDAPIDVTAENTRGDLKALSGKPEYELASLDAVRSLAALPNVKLGNHTNLHLSAGKFSDEQVFADYKRSTEVFTRLFGTQHEFAFPFGTPRWHFGQRHVDQLRELGDFTMWSTEARPYERSERKPGAVLPRYPVNGRQSARQIAGWVAARALGFRARGTKHHY